MHWREVRYGVASGERFQRVADLEQLNAARPVDDGDPEGAVGLDGEDTLGNELLQGLADRHGAGAELLGERPGRKALSWRINARSQIPSQFLMDLMIERGLAPGRGNRFAPRDFWDTLMFVAV